MRRIIFTVSIFWFLLVAGHAQATKAYLGISIGPGIPMKDLARQEAASKAAGWARLGAALDLSFVQPLGEGNFGLKALLRAQRNPTDEKAVQEAFSDPFISLTYRAELADWRLGALLLGGLGSFPLSGKASLNTSAMIGLLGSTQPALTITTTGRGGSTITRQASATTTAFAYLVGAGLTYDLSPNLYLLAQVDYLASAPTYANVATTISDGNTEVLAGTASWCQKIGTLNFSLGVALKL